MAIKNKWVKISFVLTLGCLMRKKIENEKLGFLFVIWRGLPSFLIANFLIANLTNEINKRRLGYIRNQNESMLWLKLCLVFTFFVIFGHNTLSQEQNQIDSIL